MKPTDQTRAITAIREADQFDITEIRYPCGKPMEGAVDRRGHQLANPFDLIRYDSESIDPLRGSGWLRVCSVGCTARLPNSSPSVKTHSTFGEFITFGENAFITFGENELIRFADRGGFAVCSVGFTARLPNSSPSVKNAFITFGEIGFITFGENAFITEGENELIRFADRGGFAV